MSDEPASPERTDRVVEARMKLKERYLARTKASPAMSDGSPQGSGPPNRHGMPRVPVGQHVTKTWPVLDLAGPPRVDGTSWRLTVDGAVEQPLELDFAALLALPQVVDVSDFHCVTTWSLLDSEWTGVRLTDVLAMAQPTAEASHLLTHAYDGYTTNLPLEEAVKDDVLLVHRWNGQPLPRAHGGPVRIITPQLYAWKGAKWVKRIEVLTEDRPGFWEVRGYSNTAHPWRDDRYA